MDIICTESRFCKNFSLLESWEGVKPSMALDPARDTVQELLQLLTMIKRNSNEKQIEYCMKELADTLDNKTELCVEYLETQRAEVVVFAAMSENFRNRQIQQPGCYALWRLIELSPKVKSRLQEQPCHIFVLKLMEKFPEDICTQVYSCKIIAALCEDSAKVRKEAIENRAVTQILHAVEKFANEEDCMLPAFRALTQTLSGDLLAQEEFMKSKKNYRLLVEVMGNHMQLGKVQEQAVQLMCVLASSEANCRTLVKGRTFIVALEAMKKHCNSSGIQSSGCYLLVLLAEIPEHRDVLVEQNVVNIILYALRHFPNDVEIQRYGMIALAQLAETLEQKLEDGMKNFSWTREVFITMTTHCDNPEVLRAACYALCELLEFCPHVMVDIINEEQEGNIPLHRCAMAALMLHKEDAAMCEVVCQVLASIANLSNPLRESLITKGVYLHIIAAMQQHSQVPGVQQWGCRALRTLSFTDVSYKKLMVRCGVLDLVYSCALNFVNDCGVLEEAIALIACLATDVELVQHQCAIEGTHNVILERMRAFPDQVSLTEISLEALGVLAAAEEMLVLLVSEILGNDCIETILNAMKYHCKEPAIQQKACIVIQVLAPLLSDNDCQLFISAVIDAMCQFPDERGVTVEGCVAMFIIAQIDKSKSKILVNNCAHERLFFVLENFGDDQELVSLASECIWYLGWERDLKASMLLSACAGGLLKGAICLIKKGADVNLGEGENTPLCQACKNGKEEMVQYLLAQGTLEIQSALRLSLEMEHMNIVGLLLQHLGHDKEAGIIALSGLNLGNLHPEWLSPSLSGTVYTPPVIKPCWAEHIDDAQKTMQRRAKLSTNLTFQAEEDFLAVDDSLKKSSSSDPSESLNSRNDLYKDNGLDGLDGLALNISDNDSSSTCSGLDFDFTNDFEGDTEETELSEESPLRARSISGASQPYSSLDPRVVSPLSPNHQVILPQIARRSSVHDEQVREGKRPGLKRRAFSDVERPTWCGLKIASELSCDLPFLSNGEHDSPGEETQIGNISELEPTGVFKMPSRSFLYVYDTQQSFGEGRPRSRSDCSHLDDGSPLLSSSMDNVVEFRTRELDESFSSRQKRRASVREIKANAAVRLIDASCNGMSSLQLIADASPHLHAHLAKVEKLDLSRNKLSHFPSALCDAMPMLEFVNLSHNEFSSFPFSLIHDTNVKVLNLSHNKINMKSRPAASGPRAVMLESLNLSHNAECFPDWIGDFFPALTSLYAVGNDIKKLPDRSLGLKALKILDLSQNKLKEIPSKFLSECTSLETLVASNNCLSSLPESVAEVLKNLKTVRLNKNALGDKSSKKQFSFPRFILMVPSLKVVDLSSNNLEDIPSPRYWSTQQLKELILGDNKVRKLSMEGVEKWTHLERLSLNDNGLKQVPAGIGDLTSLRSLDLSRNTGITHLPDEMGRLANLWDLQLSGLKLDLDSAILESKTRELIGFLHCRLKNSVPYYRMKLVVVGPAGRGKTTLLNQLQEDTASGPHHDVMVRDWFVKDTKAQCKVCQRKSVNYVISTWDFKGRDDLYCAFQCLLSSRTLYLVVYDVSKGVREIDALKTWLLNIHACAPEASVMIVGTHLDKVLKDDVSNVLEAIKERALSMCAAPGFPLVKSHVVLDCTEETSGVKALRNRILELITRCKCTGQSLIGARVPQNFIRLLELILKKRRTCDQELPILHLSKLHRLIQDNEIQMDNAEIQQAIRFMHEAGVLVYLDNPSCHLNNLLFIDPEWLFHFLAHVMTKKPAKGCSGISRRMDVERLIRDDSGFVRLPSDLMPPLLRLLEHYCVILPLKDNKFLLPSHLNCKTPVIKMPNSGPGSLTDRIYSMPYVPHTFWPRLIIRIQTFVVNMYAEHGAQEPQEVILWSEGVYVYWSMQAFFLISQSSKEALGPEAVVLTTPNTKHGSKILAHVVDQLDTLLEEWFPDICRMDPQEGVAQVKKQAQCPVCEGEQSHTFTLEECVAQAKVVDWLSCPNTRRLVSLRQIAPDVLMGDLEEQFRIQDGKLTLEATRGNLLGDGSYGAVYRAKYHGKAVAAKVFHNEGEYSPHHLLRQEVMFLRQLRHPSVICMVGACVDPWALIMELAPLGSLSTLLNGGQALSKGIQHRIALQVAEGLAFLHRHMIVYRDLKPHNILIFSLSLVNLVNAKISDYGIARYATRCGLTATEGTPGYRAPEIVRGDIGYNTEVDMYSFGMFLYELVTGGVKPFDDLRFRSELDAAVMKGRALDPITSCGSPPWPDMADLIEHVLEPQQDRRATAEQAYARLCCPELICLKRDIAVSKGQTVECMTVRHFEDDKGAPKMEVWVGSGLSEDCSGQVTIVDLSDWGAEGCTGTFLRDKRVTSIVAVEKDIVLAGTQSGTLWVFDLKDPDQKRQFALPVLPDSIVSLKHYKDANLDVDVVVGGLANGQLAIYDSCSVGTEGTNPKLVELCRNGTGQSTVCMAVGKKRLHCGCGNKVVVVKIKKDSVEIERRWSVEDTGKGPIRNIAVGSSSVWTSARDSHVIECWDFAKATMRGSVNCEAVLRDSGFTGDLRETRVVSLLVQHKTVWVGLGTGHVMLLDPVTRQPFKLIRRHVSAVRCLVDTRGPSQGKQTSLVLSGGMGFIERPSCEWKKPKLEFGYALVWEAEFCEQAKNLSGYLTRRRELLGSLTE